MNQTKTLPLRYITALIFSFLLLVALPAANAASTPKDIEILDRSAKAFSRVAKGAKPAVVHISVESTVSSTNADFEQFFNNPFFEQFFGPQYRQQNPAPRKRHQQGTGSGLIISKDGLILTNNHVVENADKISVTMADNTKTEAKLIGTDPATDVALIKIDVGRDLPTLELGDSDALEVGEWVIAIGNPFGLSQTVTVGVVSAKGRSRVGINEYENFIQTDAAINPGNSGGPLLNIYGQVIGINSALYSRTGGYMGIGFAIPVNMAKYIVDQLQEHGKVTRGLLGIMLQDLDEELAESFKLDNTKGILITEVMPDSPAEKAGLEPRDVIIKLDNIELTDSADIRNKIAQTVPGTKVDIEIVRNGKPVTIEVIVGEQPDDFSSAGRMMPDSALGDFGIVAQDLTSELADQLGYQGRQGVVISEVLPDSPANRTGLKPGQLIEEVNKVKIGNMKDLKQALKQSAEKNRILLRVRSGNYSRYIALRAE